MTAAFRAILLLCVYLCKSVLFGAAAVPTASQSQIPPAAHDWQHQYYDGEKWQKFESSINVKLNKCQEQSKWSSAIVTIDNRIYVVDFLRMAQLDFTTKRQRAIRWLIIPDPVDSPTVHADADFIIPPVTYANPDFGSTEAVANETLQLETIEKIPSITFENLIRTDYLFSLNDGSPGGSVENMIYILKQQLKLAVGLACGTFNPTTLVHLHQLRMAVGNDKYLEFLIQNAMLKKLCEWCAQRAPTPLVEFVCDTTIPYTAQHLDALRRLIGETEYQIVLQHRAHHLNCIASEDHTVLQQFNENFARFVELANKNTATTPVEAQAEAEEKEACRLAANGLTQNLRKKYRQLLGQMTAKRKAMRELQEVDNVTNKIASLLLNNPEESHKRSNNTAKDMPEDAPAGAAAGAAAGAPAPTPASSPTHEGEDSDEDMSNPSAKKKRN